MRLEATVDHLPNLSKIIFHSCLWRFNSLFLFDMFQVINVNANDVSLEVYGAPRLLLCVAMVTRYV